MPRAPKTKADLERQKRIAERILSSMKTKEMRPIELAQAVGVTKQSVNGWLHGHATPGPLRLATIAKTLGVSVSFLTGEPLVGSDSPDHFARELYTKLGPKRVKELLALPERTLRREVSAMLTQISDERAGLSVHRDAN